MKILKEFLKMKFWNKSKLTFIFMSVGKMCDIGCIGCNNKKCPDPLKNWRLWMKRRQKMHQTLTKKLGCLPGELLMNSADTYRGVKEEKLVLRYIQIENNFDKYRGDPNFFKLPPCLKSHEPPFKGTEYFLTRFKEEKNEIPELEYVGVPNAIMDEKDIRPRTRHLKSLWAESTYRQHVVEMVFEKLLKIEPHKPILSDLVIIGTKIGGEPKCFQPKKEISFTQKIPEGKKSKTKIKEIKHADLIVAEKPLNEEPIHDEVKLSLKINKKEFDKYSAPSYQENKISVIFEHFTDSLVPSKKSIVFENTGTVTVRLYWKYYKNFRAFMDYDTYEDINFRPFRFDKNELCLIPGAKRKLLVYFQVENPGNYFEYWEITSLPNIWTTDFRLLILLQGFSVIRNYEERISELNKKLQYKMRNTAIKEVLNNIISSGTYCRPTAKLFFNFTEKDLFESANLEKHYTPKYVYNALIISELKQFYQDNRSLNDPEQWDLSIRKLREIARKKDLLSYFDRKLILFQKSKLRREALQKIALDVHQAAKAAVVKENKQITEKNTKGRHLKSLWAESTYRQHVVEMVFEKLLKIEPHKPILSDLVIIGTKIGGEPKCFQPKKEIFFTQKIPEGKKSQTKIKEIKHADLIVAEKPLNEEPIHDEVKLSLKINKKEFDKYSAPSYQENKISVIFEHFTDSLVPSKKSIVFENTGTVTVRLYWKYYKNFKAFMDYDTYEDINFRPFRFDKNELCLIPGAKRKLLVYFQVENPGNYFEYWEITSLPNIWTTDFRLLILLQGFSVIRNYEERISELNKKLQYKMRNTAIKEVLNNIISSGTYCRPTAKLFFNFTEKDLFESANLEKHYTPKYVYNALIISELKQFYQDNRSLNDPEQWDLSIRKLREIARKKDLLSYFDRKLILFQKSKLRREALQKIALDVHQAAKAAVVKENKQITEKITKEVAQQNPHPDDEIRTMTFYKNLNIILRKLEKPSIQINKERKKYLFSYIVIKTFFSKIFNELDKLDSNETQEVKDNDSVNKDDNENLQYRYYDTVPARLMYEIFDECYILRTKRVSHQSEAIRSKPKSVLLEGISISDTKKVYKTYFNKDDTTLKGTNKDKSQGVEAKKNNALKGQKGKIPTNQGDDLSVYIKENFDPFYEAFPRFKSIEQTTCAETISSTQPKEINKDKYLIVYTTLCQAIDALEDTIEAFKDKSISSNTLSELLKCDPSLRQAAFEKPSQVTDNTNKKSLATSIPSTTSEKVLPKQSIEYSEYLEFLKDIHWQNNLSVKQHFLNEQEPKITELPENKVESDSHIESQVKQSIINIFTLEDFKRKIEPYCLKDRFTQTELLENFDESVDEVQEEVKDTTSEESLDKPRNIFYFLDHPGEKESEVTILE